MECPECFEVFDEKRRRPKALPCGHTVCLQCLSVQGKCVFDGTTFNVIPSELADSHSVLTLMHSCISTSGKNLCLWCMDCTIEATETCIDEGHKVSSQKKMWYDQALQNLHLSDDKLNPQYFSSLIDKLNEETAVEAVKILTGQVPAPSLSLLLEGGLSRWQSSLQNVKGSESEDDKIINCMMLLMASEGIIPKDLMKPAATQEDNTRSRYEEFDAESDLDLTNISSCKDQKSVRLEKNELLSSEHLSKVKRVTGLYCNRDRAWSLQVLQRIAPFVEELHIYDFYYEHVEALQFMSELRWLVLEFCMEKGNSSAYQLNLQHPSKVEFLWANFHSYSSGSICKETVKMYSKSLETLFVTLPTVHGIQFFDEVEIPKLKLLLYNTYCSSNTCGELMVELRDKFPGRKLRCMGCNRKETFDD